MGTVRNISYVNRKEDSLTTALNRKTKEFNTFVYKASHDIRGPLASIIGLANLASSEIDHKESLAYFNMIADCARQLDKTLQELLQVSAIGLGEVNVQKVNIADLTKNIFNRFSAIGQLENIVVHTKFNDIHFIHTDSRLLQLSLQYLIDNSIKYCNQNNREAFIQLQVNPCGQGIEIEIADNGIGIAPLVQNRIFEMFFRGTEMSKGAGLGLYIANKLIQKLGGHISFQSKHMEGSVFKVYLPVTEAQKLNTVKEAAYII